MIAKWAIIGLFVASALATVGNVGKPRKTTTAGVAVATVVIDAALIVAMLVWWRS